MSGFLKNLKGLFIATDEDLIAAERKRAGQDPVSQSQPTTSQDEVTSSTPAEITIDEAELKASVGEGQVDQKFMDILLESITKNNQEGYDYLEYKQALQSLKKMDMDVQTRFQSAFAMAQTMGATKNRLLETGDFYLKILKSEEEKFMLSVANQRQHKIDERKQELLAIDKSIEEKKAAIEKMTKEIAALTDKKSKFKATLADTAKKIEGVKNNFEASYKFLSAQIKDDLVNIKNYLK